MLFVCHFYSLSDLEFIAFEMLRNEIAGEFHIFFLETM